MASRTDQSIRSRLGIGFMQVTGVALVLALAAFFVMEVVRSRAAMVQVASVLAEVIGTNAAPALLFGDRVAAGETLSALKVHEEVMAGIVYDDEGEVFVTYLRDDLKDFEAPALAHVKEEFELFGSRLVLTRPVAIVDQGVLGTVLIQMDTSGMKALVLRFAWISACVMALALGVAWIGAARLREQIVRPLDLLSEGSEALARGDLSTHVEVGRSDEIGKLAQAFNDMASSLRGLVSQVGQNSRAVNEAVVVLRTASDSMQGVAGRQEAAVEDSAASIEKMSASLEEVDNAVETLADTARETSTAAVQMDTSIVEIATHMDDLAQTIDSAASSVVEMTSAIREIAEHSETLKGATDTTASSLEQLTASVRGVEKSAQASQDLSLKSAEQAERGMESVQETVDGMKQIQVSFAGLETIVSRLDEQSHSIGEVLDVIAGVVEQTNVLALNAAIISSHAGEHGRAFAVVAEEVKNLSDRTAGSTKEIGELITGVRQEIANAVEAVCDGGRRVERGVGLSIEAGKILKHVAESATQSTQTADEIVKAMGAQAEGLQRVDSAMLQVREIAMQLNRGRIDQILAATNEQSKQGEQIMAALKVFREVTEQNARRSDEMKATVDLLSERADGLDEEVGRFQL